MQIGHAGRRYVSFEDSTPSCPTETLTILPKAAPRSPACVSLAYYGSCTANRSSLPSPRAPLSPSGPWSAAVSTFSWRLLLRGARSVVASSRNAHEVLRVRFDTPWTLRVLRQHLDRTTFKDSPMELFHVIELNSDSQERYTAM